MKEELKLVREFHEKFKAGVNLTPGLIEQNRSALRYKLMKDEVEEYYEGVENNDLENIAKELADILYATFGTIIEHGLQDVIEDVFKEVHLSNMSKDYNEFKMIKGPNYFEANVKNIMNKK